jgi:N-acetylglucosaminyldiphosphoundecaprenol N-acetyl-beta-D-mannosaminyltransferase
MPVVLKLDGYDPVRFLREAARFGVDRFGYAVTPNVDHLIRFHDDAGFRAAYDDATYVLLDSRVLAAILKVTRGIIAPVCTGSDLTAELFQTVIRPDDPLVLIGGSDTQAARIVDAFGLRQIHHFNPPMGFITDAAQTEQCLRFIEAHSPFRFCLLAVGSPQQELLARRLRQRGHARGLAFCIGASINFLTGEEQRAPAWMQRLSLEWLYRLWRDPARLAHRYLVRGPRVFGLLRTTEISVRVPGA